MMRVRSATGHGQTNLRALTHFAILPDGDILDKLFIHQACQRNVIEEPVDLAAEIIPQFVRQATPTLLAVPRTIAACGFNPFINGRDNLADHDPISSPYDPENVVAAVYRIGIDLHMLVDAFADADEVS